MILHFSLRLFLCRTWENLDRFQYQIQPIKFVNLVFPSPWETEPHNAAQDNTIQYNALQCDTV